MKRPHLSILLLAGCLPLAACGGTPVEDAAREAERAMSEASAEMGDVARKVREELASGNIDFGDRHDGGDRGGDAEITPEGDLLIDGKPVEVDARERAMLLAYREQVAEVAVAGARIGLQGASLATTAMREAFQGALSGDTAEMEARIEAEAEKIRVQVEVLCGNLEPLLETQQSLAAAIPELGPYATMTRRDVEKCYDEHEGVDVDLDVGSN